VDGHRFAKHTFYFLFLAHALVHPAMLGKAKQMAIQGVLLCWSSGGLHIAGVAWRWQARLSI